MTEVRLPRVSVVIPTHNRPELVRRAVQSVLDQDYAGDIEVVVVHDREPIDPINGALPATRSLTQLENQRTPGLAGARNTGIEAASGSYLASCDDDDEWLPHKLTTQMALAQRRPGPVAAISCGLIIEQPSGSQIRVPAKEHLHYQDFLASRHMEIHTSTLLVSRAVYEEVGEFDEQLPGSYAEDYDWILRATRLGPVASVMEPMVKVHWDRQSYFAEQWQNRADAYQFLLAKHPELTGNRRNSARIFGQLALTSAAAGARKDSWRWAGRAMLRYPFEARAYLAPLMAMGLIRPGTVHDLARRMGRGV